MRDEVVSAFSGRSACRSAHHSQICVPFLVLVLLAAALLPTGPAQAVPYASGATNTGGTVSFILNEAADSVTVLLNGGATTLNLGALGKGRQSFSLGGAASFQIVVNKATPPAWTLTSSD